MRRFGYLAVLMMLSSSAQAGEVHSFVVGGHHIRIEARRHCASLSCISWSIVEPKRVVAATANAQPAPAPAPAVQVPQAPVTLQQSQPISQPVQSAPPAAISASCAAPANAPSVNAAAVAPPQAPAKIGLAATTTQTVAPPVPSTETIKPAATTQPASQVAPQPPKHEDDTPLGDWQSEGKSGLVRIEQCGRALCGYALNASTNTTGETVLSNMKSKKDKLWAGDIFSRSSGNTYYARMTLKAPNTLRVEACALGPFFCSGNNWTRIVAKSDEMVMSRRVTAEPKS
jgi:uncharacterized protein (DUF2147 family)